MKKFRLLFVLLTALIWSLPNVHWCAAHAGVGEDIGPSHEFYFTDYNFLYKDMPLQDKLEAHYDEDHASIIGNASYKRDGSPHLAKVKIFSFLREGLRSVAATGPEKSFPYFYVSGWETAVADGYALSHAYGNLPEASLKANKHKNEDSHVQDIKEDFRDKGAHEGAGLRADKDFPTESFAHSEQAFTSHVLRGGDAVKMGDNANVEAILVHIVGKANPCKDCRPMLLLLLKNGTFKRRFVKSLFPNISDTDAFQMNICIVYTSFVKYAAADFIAAAGQDLSNEAYHNSLIHVKKAG